MSKVYAEQVKKAQFLTTGLKKNLVIVKNRCGITQEQIQRLEATARDAELMNLELEKLREEVSQKAAKANRTLIELKNQMMIAKKAVKTNFDSQKWMEFGVTDKR